MFAAAAKFFSGISVSTYATIAKVAIAIALVAGIWVHGYRSGTKSVRAELTESVQEAHEQTIDNASKAVDQAARSAEQLDRQDDFFDRADDKVDEFYKQRLTPPAPRPHNPKGPSNEPIALPPARPEPFLDADELRLWNEGNKASDFSRPGS